MRSGCGWQERVGWDRSCRGAQVGTMNFAQSAATLSAQVAREAPVEGLEIVERTSAVCEEAADYVLLHVAQLAGGVRFFAVETIVRISQRRQHGDQRGQAAHQSNRESPQCFAVKHRAADCKAQPCDRAAGFRGGGRAAQRGRWTCPVHGLVSEATFPAS